MTKLTNLFLNVLKCFPYSQKLFSKKTSVLKRPFEKETMQKSTGITFYCLFSALPHHSNETIIEYTVLYNIRGINKYIWAYCSSVTFIYEFYMFCCFHV